MLIHDGARCLVTPDLFDRCAEAILHCQGLITAVPVKDTIKIVQKETNLIVTTPMDLAIAEFILRQRLGA